MIFTQLFEGDFNKKKLNEGHEPEDCDLCNGTGEGLFDGESCHKCHGTGTLPAQYSDDDFVEPDDYDDNDYGDEESYYEKSLRRRGLGEGAGNIGAQIRAAYKKIYDQGDDAVEFAYYDSPIFAQYWDEYEGDLDSIIAEVEPSELQIILDELTAAADDQGVAEGSDELYQKAIRKYVRRVANDYLGGGNAHLYGANNFDSEMFGVDPKQAEQDFDRLFPQYLKKLQSGGQGVAETRVGNRLSDMTVGSPKIVYKGGKAVGEIGLDHDPSPGQGPFYMKHYETNTSYAGYDTKKEALADLKHCIDQMNEGVGKDIATLGGIATLGIAGGLAGNYADQQQPKVEIGGKVAFVEPAHSRVPDSAMTLTGKDGKEYRVWSTKGTAQSPQRYHAVPVEGVKEAKDDLSQYSTERLKAYVKKVSGGGVPQFGAGAQLKRVQQELKRREQGVEEGFDDVIKGVKRYVKGKPSKSERETHHANRTIGAAQAFHQTSDPTEKDYIKQQMFKNANRYYKVKNLEEGGMGEIAAEYEDYKKLSPREFYNMHKVTKQQWFAQHKGLLQGNVVQGADLKTVAKADLGQNKLNLPAGYGDVVQPQKLNRVAEADKKKEDELEPQVKDVGLQRAISRAKADFPTAGSGIEALAKDFMRSQDQDQKSFDQIRQAERQQDQMLAQINQLDQAQEKEIQGLEQQNSGLAQRLQQLQSVNSNLEKKLAAMSGRKSAKVTKSIEPVAATPDNDTAPITPTVTKPKAKSKTKPKTSPMKSTAAQLAAPQQDPMAAMSQRITKGDTSVLDKVSGQSALPFEPSDNVLEPTIPQRQPDPRFAAARANASDVDARYGREIADRAKKDMTDAGKASAMYPDAERLKTLAAATLENRQKPGEDYIDPEEADYGPEYQDMVARVRKLAGQGPRKTVWDPVKRVYKTVPVNK